MRVRYTGLWARADGIVRGGWKGLTQTVHLMAIWGQKNILGLCERTLGVASHRCRGELGGKSNFWRGVFFHPLLALLTTGIRAMLQLKRALAASSGDGTRLFHR